MAAQPIKQIANIHQPVLADVVRVDNNFVTVVHWQGSDYSIDTCMQSFHQFCIGDPVLVQAIEGKLAVVQHFQRPNQPQPTLRQVDGSWILDCPEQLQLQVGKQRLSINARGDITLEGQDIVSHASGTNRVMGNRIELN